MVLDFNNIALDDDNDLTGTVLLSDGYTLEFSASPTFCYVYNIASYSEKQGNKIREAIKSYVRNYFKK